MSPPYAKEMPKAWNPKGVEERWYRFWLEHDLFPAAPGRTGPAFSIVIPPPNVTGVLHIGHSLDNALQDIVARRKRMQGWNALWLPGTDHAGIATQNVVEKALAREGLVRVAGNGNARIPRGIRAFSAVFTCKKPLALSWCELRHNTPQKGQACESSSNLKGRCSLAVPT